MSENSQPAEQQLPDDDDVEGHRLLSPDQAQQRAETARRARRDRYDEAEVPAEDS
jgi:hypothetical protein